VQWPAGSNSTAALRNSDWQRTACPGIALSLSLCAPQVCTELDSWTAGILYSRYMIHSCAKRQPVHSLHHLCKQCANNSHQMCSDTSANQGLVPSPSTHYGYEKLYEQPESQVLTMALIESFCASVRAHRRDDSGAGCSKSTDGMTVANTEKTRPNVWCSNFCSAR
jgi:hypothetical protein